MGNNESFTLSLVRSLIERKNNKKLVRTVNDNNIANRGVVNYNPSQIETFFDPQEAIGNIVISGGHTEYRSRAIVAAAICAYNKGIPVVVIHGSDSVLEKQMYSAFSHTRSITIVNKTNPIYDPFIDLSNSEISRLVISSVAKNYEIKHAGKYYIEGIAEFIRTKKINPYCKMFIRCPHHALYSKIDSAMASGALDSSTAQNIKSLLMQGQSERSNIESFFAALDLQMSSILAEKVDLNKVVNITRAIDSQGVILVDVVSSINHIAVNILANQIKSAISNGKNLLLIVDSLNVENCESLSNLLKANTNSYKTAISSNDVYSMFGCDDKSFAAVNSNSSKLILFTHSSGISCTKWAETIGQYDKQEVSQAFAQSKNYQPIFSISPGYSNTTTISLNTKREYIVKPEEISRMRTNEVYIYDKNANELAHTDII